MAEPAPVWHEAITASATPGRTRSPHPDSRPLCRISKLQAAGYVLGGPHSTLTFSAAGDTMMRDGGRLPAGRSQGHRFGGRKPGVPKRGGRVMKPLTIALGFALTVTFGVARATDGVAKLDSIWAMDIAKGNYAIGTGNPDRTLPLGGGAPEGIYGFTYKESGDTCNWCWTKGRAQDNPNIKRWVHTSWWSNHACPYWSAFYCMNKNYAHMYIPTGHKYYMSAFRWIPTYVEHPPIQPTENPPQPPGAIGTYSSGAYLTPQQYGPPPSGAWSQQVDITLQYMEIW